MRFTNHSCQANARLAIIAGRIEFYSLRPIAPGEEITSTTARRITKAGCAAAAALQTASAGCEPCAPGFFPNPGAA
jgi:hypothetical protein